MIPLSVLDLSPITAGSDAAQSFRNSLDLARHAERWGYRRFWLAEHHGMPGIASAATSVLIGYVAGGTSTIRVGAGGIMLPNHSPLVIAEQFGTLESLYPGRIDLGLGRAPGSDHATARALRRNLTSDLFIEPGQVHVKGIIDGGLRRFFEPQIYGMLKSFLLQHHKIHRSGRAPERRGFVARIVIIRRDRSKHRQIEMDVGINAPWHDEFTRRVDDAGIRMM